MRKPQKLRPLAAKRAQTKSAREELARNRSRNPTWTFVQNEFRRGMAEQRWQSRAEAARELQCQAELVAKCWRMGSLVQGRMYMPIRCTDPSPGRGYSRWLYLRLGDLEKKLLDLGFSYRKQSKQRVYIP